MIDQQDIRIIGVLGAGQMGCGIAQVFLQAGFEVVLMDKNMEQLKNCKNVMLKSLDKLLKTGNLEEHPPAILNRLKIQNSILNMGNVDFCIEAISENEDLKSEIFQNLNKVVSEKVIFASNTSSISITRLAKISGRPDKFIGMHFMNPVPIMELIEVIKGYLTSKETLEITLSLCKRINKKSILSNDSPGFIINRILMPMINEAFFTLMDGIAKPEDIDQGMKLGTRHPMGPLQLADFIGLDTCLSILQVLHNGLGQSKYFPCPLLKKYVDAGLLGVKTGQGIYTYQR